MKGNLWMEIRSEKKKGLSYAEIGRKHHIDPRTAKKYAESEEVPKYTLKQKRPSKPDPYKDYIDALLEEDNYSAALILERIRERGCQCGYTIVKDYVSQKKKELNSKATVRFETVPGLQGQVVIKRLLKQSVSFLSPLPQRTLPVVFSLKKRRTCMPAFSMVIFSFHFSTIFSMNSDLLCVSLW